MKISSTVPPAPVPASNRSKAWTYLISNLLVLPGLGSAMGRRKVGYIQMLLALGGFGITLVALVRVALLWAPEFLLPDDPALYQAAIGGMIVFLISWFWSLLTSLSFFRRL